MRYALIPVFLAVPCVLLCAPAGAGEREALEAFAEASGAAHGSVDPVLLTKAIEAVEREGGAESIVVVGRYLHETFIEGGKILKRIEEIKIKGRDAFHAIDRIGAELEKLHQRQQSGATGLGPEIDAREMELSRARRTFEEAKGSTNALAKTYEQLERHRERCAVACTTILARLPAERMAEGVRGLQSTLDVASPTESLLLVRILRHSKRVECSAALLEIQADPRTPEAARTEASCAIAALGDRASIRSLLGRIDGTDEAATKRILHAVSRTARRKLETLDEAKKWIASEPE